MKRPIELLAAALASVSTMLATPSHAAEAPLKFGVGLFQPDRDKNDATYRPLAEYLEKQLGRKIEPRTVDSWEGLAKSLANGETDIALMGPWGYVLANSEAQAQVVSTILYVKTQPNLLPAHYTGFVRRDNAFYKPIRDAGLATGKAASLSTCRWLGSTTSGCWRSIAPTPTAT